MEQYNKLEPGLYLQQGSNITPLKTRDGYSYSVTWDQFVKEAGSRTMGFGGSLEQSAAEVAWVWIAINKRRQQIIEIPYRFEQGGNELGAGTPFDMPVKELLQQTDESLQLYGTAYWLKQRNGRRVVGMRWLDPTTIEPDYESATSTDGILSYKRTTKSGSVIPIPAADIIRFIVSGMRELMPGTSAGYATSLTASILHGIDETDKTFYGNNALPLMLIKVPPATAEPEKKRLETFFKRLMNRGGGTSSIRTVAVGSDVEVVPLSFKPADMDKATLEDSKRDAILAAHDVPQSIAMSDAANYATAIEAKRSFVMSVGSRLSYIAETVNNDDDFKAAGYEMIVRVEDHTAMKEDEAQRASAFQSYVNGGFEPEAAAYLVGITLNDFPAGLEVFKEPEPTPPALVPFAGQNNPPATPENNEEAAAEEKSYRRWLKKRANPNPDDFDASYLSDEEKIIILHEVKAMTTETDVMAAEFANAMRLFNEAMNGQDQGDDEPMPGAVSDIID